jgi:hypothetical protein
MVDRLPHAEVDPPPTACDERGVVRTPKRSSSLSAGRDTKCYLVIRFHRVHKRLIAGETNFAETHHYREATAKRRHSPGTPLSS